MKGLRCGHAKGVVVHTNTAIHLSVVDRQQPVLRESLFFSVQCSAFTNDVLDKPIRDKPPKTHHLALH